MAAYVALLRAVNVSGTGKLPMAALRAACEAAGLERVSTYIASGNIVFSSPQTAATVKTLIAGLLHERFGLDEEPRAGAHAGEARAGDRRQPVRGRHATRPNPLMLTFLDGPRPPRGGAAARRPSRP